MPKRRRTSHSTEDSDHASVASHVSHSHAVQKRRKKSAYDPMDICQELYDGIRNQKTQDGRLLCEAFIRVPKRRSAADYYDVVSHPIDLLKVQNKLKNDEYEEVDQLTSDVELMVNNAKAYYKNPSQEYQDACDLWELYLRLKNEAISEAFGELNQGVDTFSNVEEDKEDKLIPSREASKDHDVASSVGNSSVAGDDELEEQCESLFTAVMTTKDGERPMHLAFQLLPSKVRYPEYYKVIKEPIDLKTIAMRIQDNQYRSLDHLEKDLALMCKNARTFNEPGSIIYKDACAIKKIIQTKKNDLEHVGSVKTSMRIRARKRGANQKLSTICAALEYPEEVEEVEEEEEDDEDDDEEEDDVDDDDEEDEEDEIEYEAESEPEGSIADGGEETMYWALFKSLMHVKDPITGQFLITPFMRLPTRRHYADYYEEIKRPISMTNIKKNIKSGHYNSLDELADDLELMFANAQRYNQDESKLFKDAVKLQKVMRQRRNEIEAKLDFKEVPLPVVSPSASIMEDLPPLFPQQLPAFIPQFFKNEMDEDDYNMTSTPKPPARLKIKKATPKDGEEKRPRSAKKGVPPEEVLRKRLWMLYKTVHDHEENGRPLIIIFMELPSKKDYPDYYHVISEPIDMSMIERKILEDKYTSEQELISDFELMFNNARHYNEEMSQVYKDAETLEKVLKKRWRSLSPLAGFSVKRSGPKTKAITLSSLSHKTHDLYNTIKDYTDTRGRILSTPFMRLPTKSEYPNYYEVIKKPIDMQRVNQRMLGNQYDNLDDMVADFVLMFDNACKYNEPDSLIYKDALTLQRICLEKKGELMGDECSNEPPDVKALVQEMMMNLFISTYNQQDEEGRCYSDSFVELHQQQAVLMAQAVVSEPNKPIKKPMTLDQIKKNLNKGRYRRMDRFQEDMFTLFSEARKMSRTDSQVYEDAVDLQLHFIKTRDELCRNGEVLLTPALSYTEKHLQAELEAERKEKLPLEMKEDEEKVKLQKLEELERLENEKTEPVSQWLNGEQGAEESFKHKGETYRVGDFVYLEPRDKKLIEPHLICVEKLWKDKNGEPMVYASWFYRPNETYHVATRKFLEKEVFKGDFYDSSPLSKVLGKCFIMSVKDYYKMKPEGFEAKDVFVCESRYSIKQKAFKKIKVWQMPKNDVKLVPREIPLVPVRVASVFANKVSADKEGEIVEDNDGLPPVLDKQRQNVLVEKKEDTPDDGCQYFEQIVLPQGAYKLGDSVFVRSNSNRPFIARIDKLWTDKVGNSYFHGPWFMQPTDVEHAPTRLFYKREVFRSSIESTTPILAVMGKCMVLPYKDYCTSRPIEYNENDVFLCESKYLDQERAIRKISKGLKRFQLSPRVCDDEIYFFRKPITPRKFYTLAYLIEEEPSPLLMKVSMEPYKQELFQHDEDSMMSSLPDQDQYGQQGFNNAFTPMDASFSQDSNSTPSHPPPSSTKKTASGKPKKKHVPSGYIVFAGECRKKIQEENSDLSFGDISKIVGTKWRNLPKAEKEKFEDRAKRIAEEQQAKQQEAERAFNESLQMYPPQSPGSSGYEQSMSPSASSRPLTPGSQYPSMPQQMQGNFQQGYAPQQQQGYPQMQQGQFPQQGYPNQPQGPYAGQGYPQGQFNQAQGPGKGPTGQGLPQTYQQQGMPPQQMPPQQPMHQGMAHQPGMVPQSVMAQGPRPGMVRPGYNQGPTMGPPPPPHPQMMPHHQGGPQMQYQGQPPNMPPYQGQVPPSYPSQGVPPGCMPPPHMMSRGMNSGPASPRQASTPGPEGFEQGANQQTMAPPMPPPRPPSPMFVAVPPRTQRLLHSEAYLRYIEGLHSDSNKVTEWDKHLAATQENTPLQQSGKLPVNWLTNGVEQHGNAVNALWALRDLMTKDALQIQRVVEAVS
ncbi:protein polybromo-1-like isoform X4 [Lineus longissimus]|uniref:protein polybromo-1-like isoform X4 n=1 Tax=Lineus longissimus TaxID=88925 RepID=UPI00315CB238